MSYGVAGNSCALCICIEIKLELNSLYYSIRLLLFMVSFNLYLVEAK